MIILAIVLGVLTWVGCGVLASGLHFAYFQRKYPSIAKATYANNRREARLWALAGPIALLVMLCHGGTKYGLKFR
jgi:hypothetical protein